MALTQLGEDEQMFRDTVRRFAGEQIGPLVRGMDESQQMDPGLIQKLFQLGLMGIEIPEQYGGADGTFFNAILAVEEISAVDPSVGVMVDVQNTLCINALIRWATEEQKKKYIARLALDHQCQRGRTLHRLRNARSRRRLQGHHRLPRRKRRTRFHPRQEGRQTRHPRFEHLRADL